MTNKGDVNAGSTTNVRLDNGKKDSKKKKHQKGNEEIWIDPTPYEDLSSHQPSTTKTSDDEFGHSPHHRRRMGCTG